MKLDGNAVLVLVTIDVVPMLIRFGIGHIDAFYKGYT